MLTRPARSSRRLVERGRYLVRIAGRNDCHTPGYAERGGDVPEAQWLVGDALGWRGPSGTTYAADRTPPPPYVQFPDPTAAKAR